MPHSIQFMLVFAGDKPSPSNKSALPPQVSFSQLQSVLQSVLRKSAGRESVCFSTISICVLTGDSPVQLLLSLSISPVKEDSVEPAAKTPVAGIDDSCMQMMWEQHGNRSCSSDKIAFYQSCGSYFKYFSQNRAAAQRESKCPRQTRERSNFRKEIDGFIPVTKIFLNERMKAQQLSSPHCIYLRIFHGQVRTVYLSVYISWSGARRRFFDAESD